MLGLLIIAGLLMGSLYELPTINVKWGTEEQIAGAETFTKEGLVNIKCYGTSINFANQLKEVDGIYGVATYVGSHKVKVLYDKAMYNDETLLRLLFDIQSGVHEE